MKIRILYDALVRALLYKFIEIRFSIRQIVVSNPNSDLQLLVIKI